MNHEIKYNQCVAEGRKIVESMKNNKFKLIELALKVCDIRVGGNSPYTMKQFSDDIGFENYETLRSWIKNYRKVVTKIPKSMIDESRPEVLFRAAKNLNLKSDPKVVLQTYQKELAKSKEDIHLTTYVSYAKNMDFFFTKSVVLSALDQKELDLFREYINNIHNGLNKYYEGKKKKVLKKATTSART